MLVNNLAISRTSPKTDVLPHTRHHDFCLSPLHYSDTDPTSMERESNPEPLHQESRALPTELPRPLSVKAVCVLKTNRCVKDGNSYITYTDFCTGFIYDS